MTFPGALKVVLALAFVAELVGMVGFTTASAVPIQAGERCYRCQRVINDRLVAAEAIGTRGLVAYKFRTVACMVKYLNEANHSFDQILVTDYSSGTLVPVSEAIFVRTAIDWRTGERHYGIGELDYVAFRYRHAAERFAAGRGATPMDWETVRAVQASEQVSLAE